MSGAKLIFLKDFSEAERIADPNQALVIYDQRLRQVSREFQSWLERFPFQYAVRSGESLKDLDAFAGHAKKISKIASSLPSRRMSVIAAGGGSVGDFAGFFASVYKRGVPLLHMPSTWLAAVDSSHGGKTALNVNGVKNQFGTFYPAERVLLVRSLLETQPVERAQEALAELAKIALIDGGDWTRELERARLKNERLIWKFLPFAIESKLKIVRRDPREVNGIRQVLNLGHTVGHVLESVHGWAHGRAVGQGLFFALEFSLNRKMLAVREAQRALTLLEGPCGLRRETPKPISERTFRSLLTQDKKREARDQVTFIFLKRIGKVERVPVPVDEIVHEARRQGLVR